MSTELESQIHILTHARAREHTLTHTHTRGVYLFTPQSNTHTHTHTNTQHKHTHTRIQTHTHAYKHTTVSTILHHCRTYTCACHVTCTSMHVSVCVQCMCPASPVHTLCHLPLYKKDKSATKWRVCVQHHLYIFYAISRSILLYKKDKSATKRIHSSLLQKGYATKKIRYKKDTL